MHNIKDIRDNLDNFKKLISKRNVKVETNNISELDKQNRTLIQNKELLEKEKKDISKKKDQNLFEKSKEISKKIEKISSDQSQVKFKLDEILSSIPNIPLDDVIEWITSLAPSGIIEFVPKNDETIQSMIKLKGDIFPEYNLENFKKLLSNKTKITSEKTVSKSGRTLFSFER